MWYGLTIEETDTITNIIDDAVTREVNKVTKQLQERTERAETLADNRQRKLEKFQFAEKYADEVEKKEDLYRDIDYLLISTRRYMELMGHHSNCQGEYSREGCICGYGILRIQLDKVTDEAAPQAVGRGASAREDESSE